MSDTKPAAHPARHGRRRQGRLHRRGAPHRGADRRRLRAGRRGAVARRRRSRGPPARRSAWPADRVYDDFATMAKREARRKNGIEAVAIVTPNHMHAPAAREFLKRGIHVICDKPLTATLARGEEAAEGGGGVGRALRPHPQLHRLPDDPAGAGDGARRGAGQDPGGAGRVRPGLAGDAARGRPARSRPSWRTDPARSGAGGSTGDIGTHAYNLASFVTGLKLEALAADLQAFVPGRRLDDNGHVLLRFEGGARGMLWCSQVAVGNENALRLRVYGEKGGLEWAQEDSELPLVHAARRAEAAADPRRRRGRAGGGAGEPHAGRASGGLPRGLRQHLCRGGAGDPGEARGPAGAEGGALPDDRRRRGRGRLRRGLRAVVGEERRLGHAADLARRAAVAGAWREAERHQRRLARGEARRRVGLRASRCSASAMPTASRSASKWESGGTSARVSTEGKVQTTETSSPTRRPSSAKSP